MSLSPQPTNVDTMPARAVGGMCRRLAKRASYLPLAINTLRYLRVRQWAYLVIRRLLPDRHSVPDIAVPPVISTPSLRICGLTSVPHHCLRDGRLCFLNESAHFDIDNPDWRSSARSRLWRYNLHYFEYLSEPALSVAQRSALIDSWIASNPVGFGDGWEPYPVSLRIISWTRYFDYLLRNGESISPDWRRSLYQHCDWLHHHMEFHIDANHLFKNIVALFLGAHLLAENDDARVRQWQRKSGTWLSGALCEQFTSDGGHYERSPMYHLLCLHYCIDVFNALSKSQTDKPLRKQLGEVIIKGIAFALTLQHSNGRLAFFNDSANGVAPALDTLCEYARSIDSDLQPPMTARYGSHWFAGSGYFCWHDARQHCIVNAKTATPSFQPGHSHADCLSYEYSLDGVPVIVNAGNTCYEIGEDRRYARSTAAHNTVEIAGLDQSELWSAFRMARRARVSARTPEHTSAGVVFGASHNGYARLGAGVVHQRDVVASPARIEIRDSITGRGRQQIRHFTHLHPDCTAVLESTQSNVCLILDSRQRVIARLHYGATWMLEMLRIDRTPYFDQFGMRQLRDTVVVLAMVDLPCAMQCTIEPQPNPGIKMPSEAEK